MIVEATGTAVSGNNRDSGRIHAAMDAAYLEAVAAGINDPDAIRERKLAARALCKAIIAGERAAEAKATRQADLLTQLGSIKRQLAEVDIAWEEALRIVEAERQENDDAGEDYARQMAANAEGESR